MPSPKILQKSLTTLSFLKKKKCNNALEDLLTCSAHFQIFQTGPRPVHHLLWRRTDTHHDQKAAALRYDLMLAPPPPGWFCGRDVTTNQTELLDKKKIVTRMMAAGCVCTSQRNGPAGWHHVQTAWTHWLGSSPPSWLTQSSTRRLFWLR